MRVGVAARHDLDSAIEKAVSIVDALEGEEVLIEREAAGEMGAEGVEFAEMRDLDLMVLVGGDGTILRALHRLPEPVPLLGVNMGEVGFLTNASPDEAERLIGEAREGFDVESRERIQPRIGDREVPPAMNEAVVITSEPAKMLHVQARVDGREAERMRSDGMIVATPTGSTAYAMSAGGPIVDPRVDGTILVPLAPFKISARPMVVPGGSKVDVELLRKGKEAKLVVDGQYVEQLGEGDVISFTRAEQPALFVKTWKGDFYSKVKKKLE